MDGNLKQEKKKLRRLMRTKLEAMPPGDRKEKSQALAKQLLARPEWRAADCVGLFSPLQSEPDVEVLWQQEALTGKRVAYSRIENGSLVYHEVQSPADLHEEQLLLSSATQPVAIHVPPEDAPRVDAGEIALLLVPGLAFTPQGLRLGKGGGFFDRFLSESGFQGVALGVCFDFQVMDNVPAEPHDQRVAHLLFA